MINDSNIESNLGVRSSENTTPSFSQRDHPAPHAQEEDADIVPLEIETAASRISHAKVNDPQFSDNLRWVRNTQENRQILTDFITKRVLIRKIISGTNWSYLPCCNVFSMLKPKGNGHKDVKWNPLLFLLEADERSKALTQKKKLWLKNNSLSQTEFKNLATPQLLVFLKAECELGKIKKLVEGLPKKEGCFHLPFITNRFNEDCPGQSPLLKSGASLDFKVDLVVSPTLQLNPNVNPQPRIQSKSKKNNNKSKKKGQNHQGGIKNIQATQDQPIDDPAVSRLLHGGNVDLSENPVEGHEISVFEEDPAMLQLWNSLLEGGDNQRGQLSEEQINDRIAKLTILKHHKQLLVQKQRSELQSLRLFCENRAKEVAGIEEEARKVRIGF